MYLELKMTQSKYIIFKYAGVCECAVVFDSLITHSEIGIKFGNGDAVSAGFCRVDEFGVAVYGHSVSMGLESRPEDAKLVERSLSINQEH